MKVVCIPDMHGSHNWEIVKSIAKEHPDYYFISLGDWFDAGIWDPKTKTFVPNNIWPDQLENCENYVKWTMEDPEHRFSVLGNHDWQYISANEMAGTDSRQYQHAKEIKCFFYKYRKQFLVAKDLDGWVFSHAGFTDYWMGEFKHEMHLELDSWPDDDTGAPGAVWDEKELNIDFINKVFQDHTHTYGDDTYNFSFDELFDFRGVFSSSGNEVCQGPFWVRPEALMKRPYFSKQVVGHTCMAVDEYVKLYSSKMKLVITDSENNNLIKVFDTRNPGSFSTYVEYNRKIKTIMRKINNLKSLKTTDKDKILAELKSLGIEEDSNYLYYHWPELFMKEQA